MRATGDRVCCREPAALRSGRACLLRSLPPPPLPRACQPTGPPRRTRSHWRCRCRAARVSGGLPELGGAGAEWHLLLPSTAAHQPAGLPRRRAAGPDGEPPLLPLPTFLGRVRAQMLAVGLLRFDREAVPGARGGGPLLAAGCCCARVLPQPITSPCHPPASLSPSLCCAPPPTASTLAPRCWGWQRCICTLLGGGGAAEAGRRGLQQAAAARRRALPAAADASPPPRFMPAPRRVPRLIAGPAPACRACPSTRAEAQRAGAQTALRWEGRGTLAGAPGHPAGPGE